jgi:hypothetical protein
MIQTCLQAEALLIGTLLGDNTGLGFQCYHLFAPLHGLKTTRYRGGDAVTPAPGGRVLHPHGLSVILVLLAYALVSKPVALTFLG